MMRRRWVRRVVFGVLVVVVVGTSASSGRGGTPYPSVEAVNRAHRAQTCRSRTDQASSDPMGSPRTTPCVDHGEAGGSRRTTALVRAAHDLDDAAVARSRGERRWSSTG